MSHRGVLNRHSGPDFHGARVHIDGQEWAGNIEIHIRSSDWERHHHDRDPAYDNVILHVVLHHDKEVHTSKGARLKTFSLEGRIDLDQWRKFKHLINEPRWIPCAEQTIEVDEMYWTMMKDRMLLQRWERKSQGISSLLKQKKGNWERTAHIWMARAMGGKVNADAFQTLGMISEMRIMASLRDDLSMMEAYLLGQAGLLSDLRDEYSRDLLDKYTFLKSKHGLRPMRPEAWKHSPVRPASAPAVRIAQWARMQSDSRPWHDRILNDTMDQLIDAFSVELDGYWLSHHALGKPSKPAIKRVGKAMKQHLLINGVSLLRYSYGQQMSVVTYKTSAISLLERLPSERNSVIKGWGRLDITSAHAGDSQALLELKNEFCQAKRCLQCSIGIQLLRR